MTLTNRTTSAFLAMLALLGFLAVNATPAAAQGTQLINPNTATADQIQRLPNMTPAIATAMIAQRPFKTAVELNAFLLSQKLTADQAKEFYGKAFVPVNLNTGTRDEILLIPGAGPRMAREFNEYRPWKTWAQFDKEIGKYVGQAETDRLKQYVLLPPTN